MLNAMYTFCSNLQICSIGYPARMSCAKTLIELENYDVSFVLIFHEQLNLYYRLF